MIINSVTFIRRNTLSVARRLEKCVLNAGRRTKCKKSYALFFTLLIIAIIYYGLTKVRQHSYIHLLPVSRETLQKYCNYPVNAKGSEGRLPNNADKVFKLDMVNIIIRHGDRSPLMTFTGIEKRNLDCSLTTNNKNLKRLFDGYHRALNNIKCKKLSPKAVVHDLSSRKRICGYYGQLTQKGFQQLIEIGKYLKTAYSDLKVTSSENVYARSTNRERTAQTAAAVLYGFVDEDVINNGNFFIDVTTDIYFREDGNGLMKPCPAFTKPIVQSQRSAVYRAGSRAMEPFMKEVADLLMMPRESLPSVPFIADSALVHFCHGLDFPCTSRGCFTESMVYKMVSYSDWSFYNNYSHYGEVLSLPVLTQIGARMLASSKSESPVTIAIYGGHESTIIPVLISLGIYNKRWIPYASRLVFELWSKLSESTNSIKVKYIRVLFNGESVTKHLVFCRENAFYEGELCPLEIFLTWLGGGRFEDAHKRYDKMCNR